MSAFRWQGVVGPEWVDYNGHMGDFAYAMAFSQAVTGFMEGLGLDASYREQTGATLYTLDMRIGYRKECHEGDALTISLFVLRSDAKRLHVYLEMVNSGGECLAWSEQVLMHVSRASGQPKAAPFPPHAVARLRQAAEAGGGFGRPAHLDRLPGWA